MLAAVRDALTGPGLDGFVSCAGIEGAAPLEDVTDGFLHDVYSTNVLPALSSTRELLPCLRNASGTVIYVGSTAARPRLPWLASLFDVKGRPGEGGLGVTR